MFRQEGFKGSNGAQKLAIGDVHFGQLGEGELVGGNDLDKNLLSRHHESYGKFSNIDDVKILLQPLQ